MPKLVAAARLHYSGVAAVDDRSWNFRRQTNAALWCLHLASLYRLGWSPTRCIPMLSSSPNSRTAAAVQILFLDFDGVMHPEFCNESKHFVHRDAFEAVMRSAPDVELVISSTWRHKRSLDELKALFAADVAARIIGTTPFYAQLEDVPDALVGYEREAECRNWLRQQGCLTRGWLAVDDRSWNFRPFNPHVFLVDGDVGLDADAAAKLAARIHGVMA